MSGTGYSQDELDDAQAQWSLRFPPDLVALLRERRQPVGQGSLDWTTSDPTAIRRSLDLPFEGFWFDVQHGLWWPEWGEKPTTLEEQRGRLRHAFDLAPKLIPVFGHRYLPELPSESGSSVFSVSQADVIYYGSDLANWMEREEGNRSTPFGPVKEVPFWSEAVRKAEVPGYWPVPDSAPRQIVAKKTVIFFPTLVNSTERPPEGGLSKIEP